MGLFRRLAGILGLAKDEGAEIHEENGDADSNLASSSSSFPPAAAAATTAQFQQHLPRKGFSVPIQVQVDRPGPGPVLLPCAAGDGGIQGLRWYAKRLRIDEDGDVADEFLTENPITEEEEEGQNSQFPRFEVKHQTRPAMIRKLALSPAGQIQLCVEHHGRPEWI